MFNNRLQTKNTDILFKRVFQIKKYIVFISSSIMPSTAANSVNVMKISEALANQDCKVELFVLTNSKDECINNEPCNLHQYYGVKSNFLIRQFPKSKFYNIYTPMISKFKKADLVYTRHPLIAYITSRLGLETVFHGHGLLNRFSRFMLKRLPSIPKLNKIAVVSEGMKRIFEEEYKINSPKLQVISNGVDFKRFKLDISKIEARNMLKIKQSERILCYSGHLYEGRGIEVILKMSKVLKEYLFIIVGGTPEDIMKWEKVANKNVKFVGHVLNDKVPLYLSSADYLLMPYQDKVGVSGGGINTGDIIRPLKMFEYMAANRPIIASDLKGLREVLNESNSVLVSPEDSSAWVEKVRLLENNPVLADKLADKARSDVMEFSCDEIAKQILLNL